MVPLVQLSSGSPDTACPFNVVLVSMDVSLSLCAWGRDAAQPCLLLLTPCLGHLLGVRSCLAIGILTS